MVKDVESDDHHDFLPLLRQQRSIKIPFHLTFGTPTKVPIFPPTFPFRGNSRYARPIRNLRLRFSEAWVVGLELVRFHQWLLVFPKRLVRDGSGWLNLGVDFLLAGWNGRRLVADRWREREVYIYIDIHMQIHSVDSKPALLWSQLVPSGLLPLSC